MMSEAPVVRKAIPQAQSTASGHTQMTSRQPFITETTASKRVCFYKSGDAQFSGLPVIINSRTFKTFEALLDSLSKRVPLPFGVRTITTPRGHTAVRSLDQLHHGQSYICSDRRTVKPIDLERARRKPPPWYHARPVSARRLAWYTHSPAQHGTYSGRRNERVLLHSPKRLVLFRNGEPEVKHTLTLQRRTTYSFEALLDHMSEVMRFPVLKLYTTEGRRVDGLPALILCSGVLVAAGREPFKKSNYDVQKSSPPVWPPAKRLGRRHPITRKKKSRSTKSFPFSLSSERYLVNQIQSSLPESMCDCPSIPNGSVEAAPGHHLESVSEAEIITSLDGEREDDTYMPSDDDIEKSFRVNQDGSMTVEMKVRLTIKEEETIHWTTTVSRSSVCNQFLAATVPCPDLDANLPDNLPPQNDTAATEDIESDPNDRKEGCCVNQQSEINGGAASMELERLPSPLAHLHKVQHKQGSIESIMTVSDTEIHEISSYSYMEDLDNGEVNQEDCMDGLSHLNTCCHTETNLRSEAMLMLQSLNELAVIEDAEHLRTSLSDLYNSASVQLLQNWKGFQVLSNKARSSSATPDTTGSESHHRPSSDEEEHSIQVLMEHLGVPERVREELAALNHVDVEYMICNQMEDTDKVSDSVPENKMNGCSELHSKEQMAIFSDFTQILEDYVSIYVNSVIDRAINAHLKDSDNSQIFTAGTLARPDMDNLMIADRYQKDLRNENFSNIDRTFQGDAIADSDICEDMPSSESSFGAEMCREMGLKRTILQEMEKVRPKRQEEETVKKHQEKEEEMRVERQWESNEGRGTWEENSSEEDKTLLKKEEVTGKVVNEIIKDIDTVEEEGTELSKESHVTCTGKLNFSVNEKVSQQEENESYCDEIFPEERSFNEEKNLTVKSSGPKDVEEQICSKEKISGHWENEIQTIQTQDQLHNKTKRTERDVALPEVQGISHFVHIESNIEVDEIQHQDLSMESRTYSEEEHVILEAPECYTVYQENLEEMSEEATECEENETDIKEEKASTVAKLISSLQDQEKSVSKRPYNTAQTFGKQLLNHINEPNLEAAEITKTTERASIDSVSSSLAFSYDSKNRDSEVHIQTNRVKSIRDMFLAKNSTDIQTQPCSPSSDLSDDHESSDRNEHQSSSSSEASREEKDACRLAIAKGYVKRTIERLYGQGSKGPSSDEKRSSSAHKVKKREGLKSTNAPRLPSINEAHTNSTPDLSYFNATSLGDSFNEPTHCITLNARVGPKDAVLIDKGRWLCRENQMSPKSCPENEDTPKHVKEKIGLAESEQDSGKEDIPYSLFGHSPMMPDKDPSFTEEGENTGCPGKTFTYFHLPNASDSEVQSDEQKTDTPKGTTENKVTPFAEPPKCCAEKHSIVTVFTPPSNKVHPMIETTPPIVTQPTKGQSGEVTRRSAEPDALEILYMFCGQHCPIL
ncbi:hypothetical protein ABG768_025975 [Culter alburnus]|uniref:Doublecortin domain-containing protein n=1 Tax=Culter alburnus TaxID=194366 RepID=A0AAW2AH61_CULAL